MRKRILMIAICIGVMSLFASGSALLAQDDDPSDASVVVPESINVRAGPDQSYVSVGALYQGEEVFPLNISDDGRWILVPYNRGFGWVERFLIDWSDRVTLDTLPVLSADVTPTRAGPATATPFFPTATPEGNYVRVSAESAFVRAGPGRGYLRLGQLLPGERVTPVARNADTSWIMIRYQDEFVDGFAWVARVLVEWEDNIALLRLPVVDEDDLTPTPTFTPSITPTPTPTQEASATSEEMPPPTRTSTMTSSPTQIATATASMTPSRVPSATATATQTPNPTDTATVTRTNTPRPTNTSTATATDTPTSTRTASATATNAPTQTASPTATQTRTSTATLTQTATATTTRTPTATLTSTTTPSPIPTQTPTESVTEVAALAAERTDAPPSSSTSPTDAPPTRTQAPTEQSGVLLPDTATPLPPTLVSEDTPPDDSSNSAFASLPLEAIVGVGVLLVVLLYIGLFVRGMIAAGRYNEGFVIDTCPVCERGTLHLDERTSNVLGIPTMRRTVRCDECRSVLREQGTRRWRYAIDRIENPALYERLNNRMIADDELTQLERVTARTNRTRETPEFIDNSPEDNDA